MYEGASLLLVEDDVALASTIRRYLSIDYDVVSKGTLAAAKTLTSSRAWDIALLDLMLPDGQSLELIPLIKRKNPECSVLIFSGQSDFGVARKALAAGADDYIVKSEHIVQELFVRIPKARERARMMRRLENSSIQERLPSSVDELCSDHYRQYMENAEREYLTTALDLCKGSAPEVASRIGLGRSTVFKKLSDLGVSRRGGNA